MKGSNIIFGKLSGCFCAALLLLGCSKDPLQEGEGGGWVELKLDAAKENVVVKSAAAPQTAQNIYKVTIYDEKDQAVKYYADHTAIGEKLWLLSGTYRVEAICGKEIEAEFAAPYLTGSQSFTLQRDQTLPLNLSTSLMGARVSVVYDEALKPYFSDYTTAISNGTKTLNYGKDETRSGYFKINPETKLLTWNLELTAFGGKPFPLSGQIQNVTPNDHYKITFKMESGEYESGGVRVVAIVVNETTVSQGDTDLELGLKRYPEATGIGFEIDEVQNVVAGNRDAKMIVTLAGFPTLKSVWVTYHCPWITDRTPDAPTTFDLVEVMKQPALQNTLKLDMFIDVSEETIQYAGNAIRFDISRLITVDGLPLTGESDQPYSFTFNMTDEDGSVMTKVLTFNKIDSDVETMQPKWWDVWAKKITVSGKWTSDAKPATLSFEYRAGEGAWTTLNPALVSVDDAAKTFSATLTGLTPNTVYSVRSVSDKKGNTVTTRTENAPQIPYSNFDAAFWSKSGNAWYANPSSGPAFWDSGNKGATTVGTNNPTEPEYNDVHGGDAACKMESKYIVVAFAAGNLFSGQFHSVNISSKIPDMTFGQSFTGRPTHMKGYYKYNSVNIDNGSYKGLGGKPDRFHMYIMVTSEDNMPKRFNSSGSPFDLEKIAATGTDGKVSAIAFGEFTNEKIENGVDRTPQTTMSGYLPFDITMKYFDANKTKKPTYVVVVFSASKYGDYFTGGTGSRLLIDDVELSYE